MRKTWIVLLMTLALGASEPNPTKTEAIRQAPCGDDQPSCLHAPCTPSTGETAKGTSTGAAPAAGGMVVQRSSDGKGFESSGEWSPALREALRVLVNHSAEGLVEEKLPNGAVMVDLKGRFRSAMVLTIGPDGKKQLRCVDQMPGEPASSPEEKTPPAHH
jgi:hypothetical protein